MTIYDHGSPNAKAVAWKVAICACSLHNLLLKKASWWEEKVRADGCLARETVGQAHRPWSRNISSWLPACIERVIALAYVDIHIESPKESKVTKGACCLEHRMIRNVQVQRLPNNQHEVISDGYVEGRCWTLHVLYPCYDMYNNFGQGSGWFKT